MLHVILGWATDLGHTQLKSDGEIVWKARKSRLTDSFKFTRSSIYSQRPPPSDLLDQVAYVPGDRLLGMWCKPSHCASIVDRSLSPRVVSLVGIARWYMSTATRSRVLSVLSRKRFCSTQSMSAGSSLRARGRATIKARTQSRSPC